MREGRADRGIEGGWTGGIEGGWTGGIEGGWTGGLREGGQGRKIREWSYAVHMCVCVRREGEREGGREGGRGGREGGREGERYIYGMEIICMWMSITFCVIRLFLQAVAPSR